MTPYSAVTSRAKLNGYIGGPGPMIINQCLVGYGEVAHSGIDFVDITDPRDQLSYLEYHCQDYERTASCRV